ncbi:MAG: sigma-54-dependent transcriptional regulator [Arenicella sp.]
MINSLYPGFGVLLVDDEAPFTRSFSLALERLGGINNICTCNDSRQVMGVLKTSNIRLVLLDLTMPHISGEILLKEIVQAYPEIIVIVVSGLNQLETAVKCIRLGAEDYFIKTTEKDRLIEGVMRAVRLLEMRIEHQEMRHRFLTDTLENPDIFAHIVTQDKSMRSIFQYLESISTSLQPILVCGESGTGKELVVQAIHNLSAFPGSLVCVNVAGLDDGMFSDTLFGHSKGAFSGAEKSRPGMIEQASHGTLFLDEIGDLNQASQVKLLRLFQGGEYYSLGSDRPKRVKARIVVATHNDLEERVREGTFRKDLYYRLRTHHIELPPLRKRHSDLAILLQHFIIEASEELQKKVPKFPIQLPTLLSNYKFPGNIRELRALVFDAVSQHKSGILSMDVFKKVLRSETEELSEDIGENSVQFNPDTALPSLKEVNNLLVEEALKRANGNQSIASSLLGISQPALSKRLKNLNQQEN